jgi:hypothetical protein
MFRPFPAGSILLWWEVSRRRRPSLLYADDGPTLHPLGTPSDATLATGVLWCSLKVATATPVTRQSGEGHRTGRTDDRRRCVWTRLTLGGVLEQELEEVTRRSDL